MEGMVTHFSHPLHSLVKAEAPGNFTCDGCKMEGFEEMFWCPDCDFKLHALCATCPMGLIFFMHPEHRLAMVKLDRTTHRCNVCTQRVLGISYRCAACDFEAHPVCALLPPTMKDGAHPGHILTFIQSAPSPCTGCGSECNGGRYRCDLCHVDLHPECLRGSSSGPSNPLGGSQRSNGEDTKNGEATDAPGNKQTPRVRKRTVIFGIILRTVVRVALNSAGIPDFFP